MIIVLRWEFGCSGTFHDLVPQYPGIWWTTRSVKVKSESALASASNLSTPHSPLQPSVSLGQPFSPGNAPALILSPKTVCFPKMPRWCHIYNRNMPSAVASPEGEAMQFNFEWLHTLCHSICLSNEREYTCVWVLGIPIFHLNVEFSSETVARRDPISPPASLFSEGIGHLRYIICSSRSN